MDELISADKVIQELEDDDTLIIETENGEAVLLQRCCDCGVWHQWDIELKENKST